MVKHTTTVKSELARMETNDVESERCPSTSKIKSNDFASLGVPAGTILRCTRPKSGHRVHESGSFQWGPIR